MGLSGGRAGGGLRGCEGVGGVICLVILSRLVINAVTARALHTPRLFPAPWDPCPRAKPPAPAPSRSHYSQSLAIWPPVPRGAETLAALQPLQPLEPLEPLAARAASGHADHDAHLHAGPPRPPQRSRLCVLPLARAGHPPPTSIARAWI